MKAVVMAGGKGSRLISAKGQVNKHVLPVYDRPMIEHVIRTLVAGGVTEVLVLLNWFYPQTVMEVLEDGTRLNCDIYYRYLREVDGPGRQLYLAEKWVGGEDFIIMLGDSLYLHPLDFCHLTAPHLWTMPSENLDDDLSKYGQVMVDGDKVTKLREKVSYRFGELITTATWLFPPSVFDLARGLDAETKGEVHVAMLSQGFIDRGEMTHTTLPVGSYIDLGTPDALLRGANMLQARAKVAQLITG